MTDYARWSRTITDAAGNIVNATVHVYRESDGLHATIYSDRTGATPKSNPFTLSNSDYGLAFFHAAGGAYKIVATRGSYSQTWRWEAVGTASEYDVSSFVLSGQAPATVFTIAALKALSTATYKTAVLDLGGRSGTFVFMTGNYASLVTADTLGGIYLKADDTATSSGAWVRVYATKVNPKWFANSIADGSSNDRDTIQAAIDLCAAMTNGGTVGIEEATNSYLIASPLTWKPKVCFDVAPRAVIKATASMAAMLQSGVGSDALSSVWLRGGRWDANFLATRIIHVKQGQRVDISAFTMQGCGTYVDGTSETESSYIRIGDASQTSTSYEINIHDFMIYRRLDSSPPTAAPANNYGVSSLNDASDCHVVNGVVSGVKKGVYGQMAHWKVALIHAWNYTPETGILTYGVHATDYGGVNIIGCQVDQNTSGYGFKIEGTAHPSVITGCQVHCTEGTDNSGRAVDIGTGSVVSYIGNTVTCDASHRYAADIGGDLSNVTAFANRTNNVVSPVTSVVNDNSTQSQMRVVSGSYTGYLTAYGTGALNLSTNGTFALLTGSGFTQGMSQDGSGNVSFAQTVTLAADPTASLHAATKQYVDNLAAGLDIKPSVRVATTANITLSGAQTIDGISVVAGDRVLVKDQSTASQNGIYVCASGSWTRATDMDAWTEVPGANVWVEVGTANADKAFVCTADAGGSLGSTSITWTQFGGTGAYQAASAVLTTLAGASSNGQSLVTAANYAAMRTLLSLGTSALIDTGTSGAKVPLLNAANTWSGTQTINSGGTQSEIDFGAGSYHGYLVQYNSGPFAFSTDGSFQVLTGGSFLLGFHQDTNGMAIFDRGVSFGGPVTKTGDFTLAATESSIIVNKASTCTVTLLSASTYSGRRLRIKTIQAQTVVSASSNVVPLAGGAAGTAILAATAGKWAELESDGTNWVIMASN